NGHAEGAEEPRLRLGPAAAGKRVLRRLSPLGRGPSGDRRRRGGARPRRARQIREPNPSRSRRRARPRSRRRRRGRALSLGCRSAPDQAREPAVSTPGEALDLPGPGVDEELRLALLRQLAADCLRFLLCGVVAELTPAVLPDDPVIVVARGYVKTTLHHT